MRITFEVSVPVKMNQKQKPFRNMGSFRKGFLCVIYYYIGESNNMVVIENFFSITSDCNTCKADSAINMEKENSYVTIISQKSGFARA